MYENKEKQTKSKQKQLENHKIYEKIVIYKPRRYFHCKSNKTFRFLLFVAS